MQFTWSTQMFLPVYSIYFYLTNELPTCHDTNPAAIMWSASISHPPLSHNYLTTHSSFSPFLSQLLHLSLSFIQCLLSVHLFVLRDKPTLEIFSHDVCSFWLNNAQHRLQWPRKEEIPLMQLLLLITFVSSESSTEIYHWKTSQMKLGSSGGH